MPALAEACQGGVGEAEVREDPPVNHRVPQALGRGVRARPGHERCRCL